MNSGLHWITQTFGLLLVYYSRRSVELLTQGKELDNSSAYSNVVIPSHITNLPHETLYREFIDMLWIIYYVIVLLFENDIYIYMFNLVF